MELAADRARELGDPVKTEGVVIAEGEPDGVAEGAGLRRGPPTLDVDRHNVKAVVEVQKALDDGSLEKGVLLRLRTLHGGTTYVLLEAPSSGSRGEGEPARSLLLERQGRT